VEQGRGCRAEAEDKPICVLGQSGTGSAANDQRRPRCYIPMDGTLGKRKRERRKTKVMIEMRQVNRETCLPCLFGYFRVNEKEKGIHSGEEPSRIGCDIKMQVPEFGRAGPD